MTFNLITARWLPCRRVSGARVWLAPHEVTSEFATDPVLALDFPRPDWNAAVTELLIGLVSSVMAPDEDGGEWPRLWLTPPTPDVLATALAPLTFAFNLNGDGPRCFQDLASLGNQTKTGIGALLIDAAGESAAKKNTDHFVKRDGVTTLSLPYAAAAIVTLQTYAPAGGAGHRTSMRGGGPLTLLVAPKRQHLSRGLLTTLWDLIWCNVRNLIDECTNIVTETRQDDARLKRVFPWLAETRISTNDEPTIPLDDADPLQAYFGMPRRIRLEIEPSGGDACSLNGPQGDKAVRSFRTQNYGVMYAGWQHPLSPYYIDKKNGRLPYHPQPGLTTYADWLAWWGQREGVPASNVEAWQKRLRALLRLGALDLNETRQHGLQAVGFDMDNMKARGFVDERIPYFEPKDDSKVWAGQFQKTVAVLVEGARQAASQLKYDLRLSKFGKRDSDGKSFKLLDNAPKDAFDEVAADLWSKTQPAFVEALTALHADDPEDLDKSQRKRFHGVLRKTAIYLFDEAVNIDTLADQDARRLIIARNGLIAAFAPYGKVTIALGLAEGKPSSPKRGAGKKGDRS
jgi:CRISPR system Cascade subunit CasA